MTEFVGQQLGNFRLTHLLGRGAFAEVYLGEHVRLNMQAAIKILHTHIGESETENFRREAQTVADLSHPHIVRVLDFDVQNSIPFLIMDYAPNGSLRQAHPKKGIVPLPLIVSYVQQMADALQYAHDQKRIHRDVKPENMLLGKRKEVLLTDFGIATTAHNTSSQSLQGIAGTIPYMAPEQIQAYPRLASDQYSLGIVVYEWLCGERPFKGTQTEIAVKHYTVLPPSMREKVPTISSAVEEVVFIALAKDPKQRFQNVQAFAQAFTQASQPALSFPSVFPVAMAFSAQLPSVSSPTDFPSILSGEPIPNTKGTPSLSQTEVPRKLAEQAQPKVQLPKIPTLSNQQSQTEEALPFSVPLPFPMKLALPSEVVQSKGVAIPPNQIVPSQALPPSHVSSPPLSKSSSGTYNAPLPPQQYIPPMPQQYTSPPPKKRGRIGLIIGIIALFVISIFVVIIGVVDLNAQHQLVVQATTQAHITATLVAATRTTTSGQGTPPSGQSIDATAAGIITNIQTASAIDQTSATPTQLATTFTIQQMVYATVDLNLNRQTGYAEAKWYGGNSLLHTSKILTLNDPTFAHAFFGFAYNTATQGAVGIYWCTQADCSDAALAGVTNFTVTSSSFHWQGQPPVAFIDSNRPYIAGLR